MAWRNTNPSDYAPKSNAIGDALTGFASVYVPAKLAKDKREAEIAYEKEKADAKSAKDAADKAAAKDAQDKKDAKVVNAILRNMDLTPNQVTSEIKIGILEDVQALGVSSAMDIYNDPAKKFTEEYAYGKTTGNTNQVAAPAQYPIGTDANATISKGNSETNTMLSEASTDLSFNVDEADKEEEKDVDTQTDLAFPEVETKEVKKYVDVEVEIPLSERTNLAIKTVEERKRIQAGLNPDNPKDAAYIKLIDAQNSISNTPVLSEYMKNISSLNDVIGRQNQLDADPNVSAEEKDATRNGSIAYNLKNAANDYIEAAAEKAKKEQTPVLWSLRNSDGEVTRKLVRGVETDEGIVVNGVLQKGNYQYIPEDSLEAYMKFNNKDIKDVKEYMATTANLTRDMVDLRGLIQGNPALTNRFAVTAADVSAVISEGFSFLSAAGNKGQKYTYDQAVDILATTEGMVSERKELEMLKLSVGYGLAAVKGSSGMGLSDKELKAQLDTVIANGNPAKAMSLLNRQIKRLVESSETKRSGVVRDLFSKDDVATLYKDAMWNIPMSEYLPSELGEERTKAFNAALAGDVTLNVPEGGKPKNPAVVDKSTWQSRVNNIQNSSNFNDQIAAYNKAVDAGKGESLLKAIVKHMKLADNPEDIEKAASALREIYKSGGTK
jgi:hypothetical protein